MMLIGSLNIGPGSIKLEQARVQRIYPIQFPRFAIGGISGQMDGAGQEDDLFQSLNGDHQDPGQPTNRLICRKKKGKRFTRSEWHKKIKKQKLQNDVQKIPR